jgi:YNFM family putative membrane transporter
MLKSFRYGGGKMRSEFSVGFQALVFSVVATAFTAIYIVQPVLPVLQEEFAVDAATASLAVSAVIFGIALANLPFGVLADRYPLHPIILTGGLVVAAGSLICAFTTHMALFIAVRFVQGLLIPSLTTCVASYLSRSLPAVRLNVAMGSYVAATVAGGLGGRLLGGWIHPPLHWRYAFISVAALVITATVAAFVWLPAERADAKRDEQNDGFMQLLSQPALLRTFLVAFGAFFVFSSTFNYLPFYLSQPPFSAPTEVITFMYLAYLAGIIIGPLSGKLANRIGSGATMTFGALVFAGAIAASLIHSLAAVALSLVALCAGFFSTHSAAVGLLNRSISSSRGRANSLYVLFYYVGGAVGITASGQAFARYGWTGVAVLNILVLLLPLTVGVMEIAHERAKKG